MGRKQCFALLSVSVMVASLLTLPAAQEPVQAREQTLALCEGTRNTIRIYSQNGRLMMRAFDQQTNHVWLNAAVRHEPDPEGVDYFNNQGEQRVHLWVTHSSDSACSITVGTNEPERGTLLDASGESSRQDQTVALCEGTRNTVRIYDRNERLMMRAFDQQTNRIWLNTDAREEPNPEGTDYFNNRGEHLIRLFVSDDDELSCSITISTHAPESGRLVESSP